MDCLHPMSLPRPNGSGSSDRIIVPCGKCMSCLKKHRNHWSFRLEQELKEASTAFFITLTYDDKNLKYSNEGYATLNKSHLQLFLKRLRKHCDKEREKINEYYKMCKVQKEWPKIKYYAVGEYGSKTLRPHYHIIIFNIPYPVNIDPVGFITVLIREKWTLGNVLIGSVNPSSIAYVTKYVITHHNPIEGRVKEFSLISTKPAIGSSYINKMKGYHLDHMAFYAPTVGGKKIGLPRYFRDKIFTPHQNEVNNENIKKRKEARQRDSDNRKIKNGEDPILSDIEGVRQFEKLQKNRLTKSSKL